MRVAAAAILGFVLAGCAPAAQTAHVRAPAGPVSQWQDGAGDDLGASASEAGVNEHLAEARSALLPVELLAPMEGDASQQLGALSPDVIHRARIEMAREALVEENQNKERVDLAEELQRELAALQSTQTSKSRVRHGGPTKKQP